MAPTNLGSDGESDDESFVDIAMLRKSEVVPRHELKGGAPNAKHPLVDSDDDDASALGSEHGQEPVGTASCSCTRDKKRARLDRLSKVVAKRSKVKAKAAPSDLSTVGPLLSKANREQVVDAEWARRHKAHPHWLQCYGATPQESVEKLSYVRMMASEYVKEGFDWQSFAEQCIADGRPGELCSDDEEEQSYRCETEYVMDAIDYFFIEKNTVQYFVRIALNDCVLFEGFLPRQQEPDYFLSLRGVSDEIKGSLNLNFQGFGSELATTVRNAWRTDANQIEQADDDSEVLLNEMEATRDQRISLCVVECGVQVQTRLVLLAGGSSPSHNHRRNTLALLDCEVFGNDNHCIYIRPYLCFNDGELETMNSVSLLLVHRSD